MCSVADENEFVGHFLLSLRQAVRRLADGTLHIGDAFLVFQNVVEEMSPVADENEFVGHFLLSFRQTVHRLADGALHFGSVFQVFQNVVEEMGPAADGSQFVFQKFESGFDFRNTSGGFILLCGKSFSGFRQSVVQSRRVGGNSLTDFLNLPLQFFQRPVMLPGNGMEIFIFQTHGFLRQFPAAEKFRLKSHLLSAALDFAVITGGNPAQPVETEKFFHVHHFTESLVSQ